MRAIQVDRWGGPEVLTPCDVPVPEPGAGEVRVQVKAVGVNPVETYIRAGGYARQPSLPWVPGSDAAGVVEATGSDVTGLREGDRVYVAALLASRNTGTYAEYVVCDAACVRPLPAALTFSQGAAIGVPYLTAWRGLFLKAGLQPGERVLVNGASGAVGLAAVQMARAWGAFVIGSAGTDRGRELVRSEGAHAAIDHSSPGRFDEVLTLTGRRGVDVVIEMLANVNLEHDLVMLAPRGRIVIIGSRGSLEFNPRLTMGKDATVTGTALWNATPEEDARAHAGVAAGLEQGTLRPVVGKELPLADAPRAHEDVLAPGAHGKIVLLP